MSVSDEVVVAGDPASCSRLGAVLRHHGSRLGERRDELAGAQHDLSAWSGEAGDAARGRLSRQLVVLAACADALDRAGAEVQRYATDLAEAKALGHRAEQSARAGGLRIADGRVVEPWGVASSADAERRLALAPQLQAVVEAAEAAAERARTAVQRASLELSEIFAAQSRQLRAIPPQ